MLVVILYHNYATLSIRLYASDKKYSSFIINTSSTVIPATDSTIKRHNCCHSSVNLFSGFFLIGLDISGGVGSDIDVVHIPPQNRVTAVGYLLFKHQFHQFLCRRRHILKSLSERYDSKSHALKVLHHLNCAPTVESYLSDIETLTEPFNEFLNKAVVNHISLGGLQVALTFPHIIRDMVTVYTQGQIILGNPEVRQNDVFVLLIKRRKNKHERSNIRG